MSVAPADASLEALEAALARHPEQAELHYGRAAALERLGRLDEAKQAYLAALARAPDHFGALNDLGALLYRTHFRAAARLAYAEAVKHHPGNPVGRINLANALLAEGELDAARLQFEAALQLRPDHPDAHRGLANLLQTAGDEAGAARHRQLGQGGQAITRLPHQGEGTPCRVLLLTSALGGNTPTRALLDESLFDTFVLTVEAFTDQTELPAHDVVFNAIADADLCGEALLAARRVLARVAAPVVNPPERVTGTGRAGNARRLAGLPGVAAPRIETVAREDLPARAQAFGYPLLLRSPGYHTGQHFKAVDGPEELAGAAADLPGRELLMIQRLDARDRQGRSRKYRVMMIGGELHPLHLAISPDWKVHYFTADMRDRPEHRTEEEAFLRDMPGTLGPPVMVALASIQAALGLDYAGVDFGLGPGGELLLFEANATMVVNPPGPEPMWDYQRAPVRRILDAAREMIRGRAAASP